MNHLHMQASAAGEVASAGAATVRRWLEEGRILLVDVREPSEYEREHIPGALLLPLSAFEPALFPRLPGRRVVLHCAIGKRSRAAGKMLLKAGHENVLHLSGGLAAWKEAGFETECAEDPPQEATPSGERAGAREGAPSGAHPGRVLLEEFMRPAGLSAAQLARKIGLPEGRLRAVLQARAPVDAALSLRLSRAFATEEDFWLQLQIAHDLHHARNSREDAARPQAAGAGRGRCA